MSSRFLTAAALAAAAWVALGATVALADPWSLAPGEYYTQLTGFSSATQSYYNDDSKRTDLGYTAGQRVFSSYTEFGWKKHLSAQLGMPFITHAASMPGASMTRSGLGDFDLGLRWKLANGTTAAALQFDWTTPTGYNRKLPLAIGSGTQSLALALHVGGSAGRNGFWQLSGGYLYDYLAIGKRTSGTIAPSSIGQYVEGERDWSDHATVSAAYAHWFGRLLVAGLYDGFLPVRTGRGYDVTAQRAGPRFTYRVDERLDAFGGSWHTPGGRNSLHYDEYYAGVAFKVTKLGRLQGFLGSDK
jgi:hypothetical protein